MMPVLSEKALIIYSSTEPFKTAPASHRRAYTTARNAFIGQTRLEKDDFYKSAGC
jgi:hypothetical protein